MTKCQQTLHGNEKGLTHVHLQCAEHKLCINEAQRGLALQAVSKPFETSRSLALIRTRNFG